MQCKTTRESSSVNQTCKRFTIQYHPITSTFGKPDSFFQIWSHIIRETTSKETQYLWQADSR